MTAFMKGVLFSPAAFKEDRSCTAPCKTSAFCSVELSPPLSSSWIYDFCWPPFRVGLCVFFFGTAFHRRKANTNVLRAKECLLSKHLGASPTCCRSVPGCSFLPSPSNWTSLCQYPKEAQRKSKRLRRGRGPWRGAKTAPLLTLDCRSKVFSVCLPPTAVSWPFLLAFSSSVHLHLCSSRSLLAVDDPKEVSAFSVIQVLVVPKVLF